MQLSTILLGTSSLRLVSTRLLPPNDLSSATAPVASGFQKWRHTVSSYLESTTKKATIKRRVSSKARKVANTRESTLIQCLIGWWVDTILPPSKDTIRELYIQFTGHILLLWYKLATSPHNTHHSKFRQASCRVQNQRKPIRNMLQSCVDYSFKSTFLSHLGSFEWALTTEIYLPRYNNSCRHGTKTQTLSPDGFSIPNNTNQWTLTFPGM